MKGEPIRSGPEIGVAIDTLINQSHSMSEELLMLASKLSPIIHCFEKAPSLEPEPTEDKYESCQLAAIINRIACELERQRDLIRFLATNQQLQ